VLCIFFILFSFDIQLLNVLWFFHIFIIRKLHWFLFLKIAYSYIRLLFQIVFFEIIWLQRRLIDDNLRSYILVTNFIICFFLFKLFFHIVQKIISWLMIFITLFLIILLLLLIYTWHLFSYLFNALRFIRFI